MKINALCGEFADVGSLPCPVNVDVMPSAAATGIRKRSVEPLSQQSASAVSGRSVIPVTSTVSSWISNPAPSAFITEMVASMSLEKLMPEISEVPLLREAQISIRCAMLLEDGIRTVPINL